MKSYKYILFFLFTAFFTSCENELEIEPQQSQDSDITLSTEGGTTIKKLYYEDPFFKGMFEKEKETITLSLSFCSSRLKVGSWYDSLLSMAIMALALRMTGM